MLEADTLAALFGEEEDFDLSSLAAMSESEGDEPLTDAELEAMMREQWGLAPLDVSGAMRSAEAGRVTARPDDSDQDDFTEEEWTIVKTMRKFCLDAIAISTPAKRRAKSIEWLFVRGVEDPRNGVSFHLSCQAFRCRPWVIQALIQHFWYLRDIVPPVLPFLADPLPDSLQSEAILHGWEDGMRIAATSWMRPGAVDPVLREAVGIDSGSYGRSMDALVEAGVIGLRLGRVYVTSRPASFRRTGQSVSWSNSFLGA